MEEGSAGEDLDSGLLDGRVMREELDGRRGGRATIDNGDGLGGWVETDGQVQGTAGRV